MTDNVAGGPVVNHGGPHHFVAYEMLGSVVPAEDVILEAQ